MLYTKLQCSTRSEISPDFKENLTILPRREWCLKGHHCQNQHMLAKIFSQYIQAPHQHANGRNKQTHKTRRTCIITTHNLRVTHATTIASHAQPTLPHNGHQPSVTCGLWTPSDFLATFFLRTVVASKYEVTQTWANHQWRSFTPQESAPTVAT